MRVTNADFSAPISTWAKINIGLIIINKIKPMSVHKVIFSLIVELLTFSPRTK